MLRKKWLRVLLWTVSGLIAALALLLLAVYFILKSPAMQQKIVHSLKEPLAKQGVDLSVGSLSIDLLAGVHLQALQLAIHRAPEIQGTLGVEDLRLGYAIWPLFHRRLDIREAKLVGVEGDLNLKLPPAPEEPPPDPEALTKLIDLLRHPPLSVELPEFAMERVKLRLKLEQGPMTADLKLSDMSLRAAVALHEGGSALKLDASLPLALTFAKGAEMSAESSLLLEPHLSWDATLAGQDFAWKLKVDGTTLTLGPTHVAQGKQVLADIKELALTVKLALDHEGKLPQQTLTPLDLALPLAADGAVDLAVAPLSFTAQTSQSQGSVSAKAKLDFAATLPRDLKKPEDLSWSLKNRLTLEKLQLFQAKKKAVAVPRIELALDGKGANGQGSFDVEWKATKIELKALQEALTVSGHKLLTVDVPKRSVDLSGDVTVNQKSALSLKGHIQDLDQSLTAKLGLELHSYPSWKSLHKSIGQLAQLGWPSAWVDTDLKVLHSEPLEELKDWSKLTITNKLTVDLKQTAEFEKALVTFKTLKLKLDADTLEKAAKGELLLHAEHLQHKALKKPVTVDQKLTFSADFKDLIRAQLKGDTRLDGKELLDLSLDASEAPRRMQIRQQLGLKVDPSLKPYLSGLDILDELGQLSLESKADVTLTYPNARIRDVKSWDPARLNATVHSVQQLSQAAHQVKYRLLQPLHVETLAKLANAQLDLSTHVRAPALEAEELATLSKLESKLDVKVSHIGTQDKVDIQLLTAIKGIKPLMASAAKVQDVIQNLTLKLKAQILHKDKFLVNDVQANVDGALMAFKGKGDVTLSTGRGGFEGSLRSRLPPGRNIAGLKGSGGFELPFTITLYDKKVLAIQSEPRFDRLSFNYGDDVQVEGMDGKLSLAEELSIDEKGRIGFLYLNTQNPFTRVDFENINPYLGQRIGLRINKLRFKHVVVGPLLSNFELKQNLVLLNEMKANLLNGSALGRVFVDLHPERLQLGFLGRFSNLQLELLKEPARRKKVLDELSGRAAANFDIRKRMATGRIDVTSIGRNQLLSMIDVLDPEYKDTQMMTARRALQVSYPSLVSISMEQGLMDLLIGLGGAVSTDLSIRSIPLTAFINANAGEQLLTLETFLQTGGQ